MDGDKDRATNQHKEKEDGKQKAKDSDDWDFSMIERAMMDGIGRVK